MGKTVETVIKYCCDCCGREGSQASMFIRESKVVANIGVPGGVVTMSAVVSIEPVNSGLDICKHCVVRSLEQMITEI